MVEGVKNNFKRHKEFLDGVFDARKYELTEKEQKEVDNLKGERKEEYEKTKQEVEQIGQFQYVGPRPNHKEQDLAHFRGRVLKGHKWVDASVGYIDPKWVDYFFDEKFVEYVKVKKGEWVPIPVGKAREDEAPPDLLTSVPVQYQQHTQAFCAVYALASAVHYAGYVEEAKKIANEADLAEHLQNDDAMEVVRLLVKRHMPSIAQYEATGKLKKTGKAKKLSVQHLCAKRTPYPTVIIPQGNDSSINHVICVIHDLIFDSTQQYALKLCPKSFHWICGELGCFGIYGSQRFEKRLDKNTEKYIHVMQKNY